MDTILYLITNAGNIGIGILAIIGGASIICKLAAKLLHMINNRRYPKLIKLSNMLGLIHKMISKIAFDTYNDMRKIEW